MADISLSNLNGEKQAAAQAVAGSDDMDDKKQPAQVYTSNDIDSESESQWTTTRLELWSYYLYYVGNNGLSG